MNKKNKYPTLLVAVIGLVVIVTTVTVASAGMPFWDKVAQYVGSGILSKVDIPDMTIEDDASFGAIPGNDIYEKIRFHEGLRTASDIVIDLNLTATTTAVSNPIMGEFCNTDDALLVTNWGLHITNANENFGFPINVGTTTCQAYSNRACVEYDSSGNSTGTTTGTLLDDGDQLTTNSRIATSTIGGFWRDDIMNYIWYDKTGLLTRTNANYATMTPGTYYTSNSYGSVSSTPFTLNTNDCIVVNDFQGGATSSNSYNTGQGDFNAYFYAETLYK